jgi:phage gp45-like
LTKIKKYVIIVSTSDEIHRSNEMNAIETLLKTHGWSKVRLNTTNDGILATAGKMTLEVKATTIKVNNRVFSTCAIIPFVDEARSFIYDAA